MEESGLEWEHKTCTHSHMHPAKKMQTHTHIRLVGRLSLSLTCICINAYICVCINVYICMCIYIFLFFSGPQVFPASLELPKTLLLDSIQMVDRTSNQLCSRNNREMRSRYAVRKEGKERRS